MAAKARFGVANGYSGEPLPVMSLPAFETAIVHGCANTHGAARVHRSRKFEAICGVLVRSEGVRQIAKKNFSGGAHRRILYAPSAPENWQLFHCRARSVGWGQWGGGRSRGWRRRWQLSRVDLVSYSIGTLSCSISKRRYCSSRSTRARRFMRCIPSQVCLNF